MSETFKVWLEVNIMEHDDDSVSVKIWDRNGHLFTRKDRISTWDASVLIGSCAFELPRAEVIG